MKTVNQSSICLQHTFPIKQKVFLCLIFDQVLFVIPKNHRLVAAAGPSGNVFLNKLQPPLLTYS